VSLSSLPRCCCPFQLLDASSLHSSSDSRHPGSEVPRVPTLWGKKRHSTCPCEAENQEIKEKKVRITIKSKLESQNCNQIKIKNAST
jgi:hypothetical protein